MPSKDPWVIVFVCPTEANAKLYLGALKEMGVEAPAMVAKLSELRGILQSYSETPKAYNKVALDEIEQEKIDKGKRYAAMDRVQSQPKGRLRRA